MKRFIHLLILLLVSTATYPLNTITGTFLGLNNQQIKLVGFSGFDTYTIDSVNINDNGTFSLSYDKKDYGIGYLSAKDNKLFFIVLSGEDIFLKGDSFAESIEILKGKENRIFEQYASEHAKREQALSAWGYLEKVYTKDSLFTEQETPKLAITKEMKRIKSEDSLFLAGLHPDSYVSWYLPVRKLVSSVSTIAQHRTEEIPTAIASFREIDYTDARLQKSGLLADVIESHFWLLENSGRSLDSVYIEMNKSIDILIRNLLPDEQRLNEITEHLFKFLEKRSLFKSSEYLALKLLNEQSCTINNDFAAQLESYRAMKKGNIAPDFDFNKDVIAPGDETSKQPKKLSEIRSKYIVVVFGASWCPRCPQELSKISGLYKKLKEQGVEVVFVSLDEDERIFKNFAKVFPFISTCDYQKWESPIVQSFHVFATPTIYLLNDKREILLRPNLVSQLDSWIDWYLVLGNK
jgi:thiol-disulfide isomerase/thioredoxin